MKMNCLEYFREETAIGLENGYRYGWPFTMWQADLHSPKFHLGGIVLNIIAGPGISIGLGAIFQWIAERLRRGRAI